MKVCLLILATLLCTNLVGTSLASAEATSDTTKILRMKKVLRSWFNEPVVNSFDEHSISKLFDKIPDSLKASGSNDDLKKFFLANRDLLKVNLEATPGNSKVVTESLNGFGRMTPKEVRKLEFWVENGDRVSAPNLYPIRQKLNYWFRDSSDFDNQALDAFFKKMPPDLQQKAFDYNNLFDLTEPTPGQLEEAGRFTDQFHQYMTTHRKEFLEELKKLPPSAAKDRAIEKFSLLEQADERKVLLYSWKESDAVHARESSNAPATDEVANAEKRLNEFGRALKDCDLK